MDLPKKAVQLILLNAKLAASKWEKTLLKLYKSVANCDVNKSLKNLNFINFKPKNI